MSDNKAEEFQNLPLRMQAKMKEWQSQVNKILERLTQQNGENQ